MAPRVPSVMFEAHADPGQLIVHVQSGGQAQSYVIGNRAAREAIERAGRLMPARARPAPMRRRGPVAPGSRRRQRP